jgi:hypothetical protein
MGRLVTAVICVAALAVAPAARGADVGANDDTLKYAADGAGALFAKMAATGLRQTILTVRWRPSAPDTVQDADFLDRAVPEAAAHGIRVVLAVYPYPPREIEAGLGSPGRFAAYVRQVALRYPQVRQFVIGNEPNQSAFWRPQLGRGGAVRSAAAFGPYLAAAYDVLKTIDPTITVVGVGLSPRGNDNARARSNQSSSPVRFIAALGAWYRASGRVRPLMDGFSYHPYPRVAGDGLLRDYVWPHAGFRNLSRVKQALWDAFAGTGQPTTPDGLRLYLDEVGWQVDTAAHTGYAGTENVPVTSEERQAAIYAELVRRVACDPDIAQLNFFGFHDDASRTGFQAALHRLDGTARPAAAAVRRAIAATARGCPGKVVRWQPTGRVVGATAEPWRPQRSGAVKLLVGAREDARALVCLVPAPAKGLRTTASGAALERRALAPCWRGRVTPRARLEATLAPPADAARFDVAVRLQAVANPSRVSLLLPGPRP